MADMLYGSACTTLRFRAELQRSKIKYLHDTLYRYGLCGRIDVLAGALSEFKFFKKPGFIAA